jgi:hypothetical protein
MRPSKTFEEGLRLPNIEDPGEAAAALRRAAAPASASSRPTGSRARPWSASYDERWQKERAPFCPRTSIAATSTLRRGLVTPYRRGDETVGDRRRHAPGQFRFNLPGAAPPLVRVALHESPRPGSGHEPGHGDRPCRTCAG